MTKPVLLAVGGEPEARRRLEADLARRYGADYDVRGAATGEEGLDLLEGCRRQGTEVPIAIADLWLPDMTGLEFLARAREARPAAKRVLFVDWNDPRAGDRIVEGATFGVFDRVMTKQGFPAEEWLYPTVSEFLADWSRTTERPRFEAVRVVGRQWAARSYQFRDILERSAVPFGFYPDDSEEGQRLLREAGQAGDRLPVVLSFDGRVLVDPTNEQVAALLGARTDPEPGRYDVAIVGAGPAGLSAAVYGASEGLRTLVLESQAIGGQAGASSRIRNYLGFPEGISGARLAHAASHQARSFGATLVYDEAVSLRAEGRDRILVLADGGRVACRAVVIATGVAYRRLAVPALEALVGAGVFYGAAGSEARALRGQEVFVVGAGNSAGQAALHLCGHAARVTILARGETLAEGMSDYLIKEIGATGNVAVRLRTEVVDGGGAGRLQWLGLRRADTGATETVPAAAVFVLIGGEPRTEWLAGAVARDAGGYVLTGRDLIARGGGGAGGWPLDRPPAPLEASMPGVFAVGDVRHGATKRVAMAVGDGALAIRLVHDSLVEQTVGVPRGGGEAPTRA